MSGDGSARLAGSDRGQAGGGEGGASYRWTCPVCGASRVNPAGEEVDDRNAVTALRSHVLASSDGGHGPANAYPEGFDPSTLADRVVRVDRRGEPVESEG